ncbi:MAG: 3'(2'),5'-bisphosphate nucleotidase CysQ [Alphaproteobacteria bacterium]|nr:3'(2'),5'-bisphosphate nucleotidase CysQ [Alphaproteobacteria bacterium]
MTFPPKNAPALRTQIVDIARRAGTAILDIYNSGYTTRAKPDRTPVTDADERAEALIVAELRNLTPEIPIVGEEGYANGRAGIAQPPPPQFWLVDPLDGTREFVARNGQFSVNIGLVSNGRPLLGVIHAPADGLFWSGCVGAGAFRQKDDGPEKSIQARGMPQNGLVIVTSRSHASGADSAVASAYPIAEHRKLGSAAKFGLIAEGTADLYPRMGPTSEWDTCAGEAILVSAGGHVERTDGRLLEYGKLGFRNPDFVARGAW